MPRGKPQEPWKSFWADLDEQLVQPVAIHCCGGFVVTQFYGVARTTADIDFISLVPRTMRDPIIDLAGKGSPLHQKHRVYLDAVTVVTPPVDYAERLIALYPGCWQRLALYAMEAHDIALTKLERNIDRDRNDVQRLASAGLLDRATLRARYYEELRPYLLARHSWHDQTLDMWLESYW